MPARLVKSSEPTSKRSIVFAKTCRIADKRRPRPPLTSVLHGPGPEMTLSGPVTAGSQWYMDTWAPQVPRCPCTTAYQLSPRTQHRLSTGRHSRPSQSTGRHSRPFQNSAEQARPLQNSPIWPEVALAASFCKTENASPPSRLISPKSQLLQIWPMSVSGGCRHPGQGTRVPGPLGPEGPGAQGHEVPCPGCRHPPLTDKGQICKKSGFW